MKDSSAAFSYTLAGLNRAQWMEQVEDIAEDYGYAEPLGPNHTAMLIDAGRTLLVTFEAVSNILRDNRDDAPIGWGFVQTHGWSSLTLMADHDEDWFRHPAIYGYFDRLIDDGFFDDFDQVLFYGAGPAGYAAAAFSVCAPDTHVLLIQPQATMDWEHARWDRRYPKARRLDFRTRFGYAPTMVETAADVVVIHDPSVVEDAVHSMLFNGPNTRHFKSPYIGPKAQRSFIAMDILRDLIEEAMDGTLWPDTYANLWRARRNHVPYLRTLMHRLEAEEGHDLLLALLCEYGDYTTGRPVFAKKLAEVTGRNSWQDLRGDD